MMAVSKSMNRLGRVVFDVHGPADIDASMRFRSLAVGVESNLAKDGANIRMDKPLTTRQAAFEGEGWPEGLLRRAYTRP